MATMTSLFMKKREGERAAFTQQLSQKEGIPLYNRFTATEEREVAKYSRLLKDAKKAFNTTNIEKYTELKKKQKQP